MFSSIFPFKKKVEDETVHQRILGVLRTTLETDIKALPNDPIILAILSRYSDILNVDENGNMLVPIEPVEMLKERLYLVRSKKSRVRPPKHKNHGY